MNYSDKGFVQELLNSDEIRADVGAILSLARLSTFQSVISVMIVMTIWS